MKKVFAEIGFGNDTFLSTEFEEGESEYRVPKFVLPNKIHDLYFRFENLIRHQWGRIGYMAEHCDFHRRMYYANGLR